MTQTHNVVERVVDVVDPGFCFKIVLPYQRLQFNGNVRIATECSLGIFEAAEYFGEVMSKCSWSIWDLLSWFGAWLSLVCLVAGL